MKRTSVALLAGLGMAAGAWFGLRPHLERSTVAVLIVRPNVPAPFADAVEDGATIALEERAGRAGDFYVELRVREDNLWLFTPGRARLAPDAPVADDVVAVVAAGPGPGLAWTTDAAPPPPAFAVLSPVDTFPRDPARCAAGTPHYFRVLPDDRRTGRAAAGWARELGASRALVLTERHNARSGLVAAAFVERARELGLEADGPVPVAALLPRPPVDPGAADVVFFAGEDPPYATAHDVFRELRDGGYAGVLMMADASPHVSYLVAPGPLVEGTRLVSPFSPPPEKFAEAFRKRFGRPAGPHAWSGYRAAEAAFEAVERATAGTPEAVRLELSALPRFDAIGEAADAAPHAYVVRDGRFEPDGPLE